MRFEDLVERKEYYILFIVITIVIIADVLNLIDDNYISPIILLSVGTIAYFELQQFLNIKEQFSDVDRLFKDLTVKLDVHLEQTISEINEKTSKITNLDVRTGNAGELWKWEDGMLEIGSTRNVSLRTKTVQMLLDGFNEYFHKENLDEYYSVLYKVSYHIGSSFGEGLKQILRHEQRFNKMTDKDKIDYWFMYDSDTGMGKFLNEIESNNKIKIRNSFLTADRAGMVNRKTCVFYKGYIEGMFENFLQKKVKVEEVLCASEAGGNHCEFTIEYLHNQNNISGTKN